MTNNDVARTALTFAAGAAVGGLASLLFAPMSGRDLRTRIAEEAESGREAAENKLHELQELTNEKLSELSHRASATIERGTNGARDHGAALSAGVRAGLDAYEKSLDSAS